jgi:hypothetical protein
MAGINIGRLGAPSTSYSSSSSSRVSGPNNDTVYATWRPKPIMPHSVVAQSVMLDKNEYATRTSRNPEQTDYPISGKVDVEVCKGELAFELPPPFVRRNNPNMTDVNVFTSANGLRAADCPNLRFVGQVMKGASLEDEADKSVSVQVSGPMTTVNMSSKWIYAGNTVIARWPEYNIKNGKKVPKVQVMGTPPSKFLFNLAPLTMVDIYSEFMDIMYNILKYATSKPEWRGDDEKGASLEDMFSQVRHFGEPYSILQHTSQEPQCPVFKFVRFVCTHFMTGDREQALSELDQSGQTDVREAHDDAMNGLVGKRRRNRRADSITGNKKARIETNLVEAIPPSNINADFITTARRISLPLGLVTEQYNLLHRLAVGKALTTAGPGQPLDILMGYYH